MRNECNDRKRKFKHIISKKSRCKVSNVFLSHKPFCVISHIHICKNAWLLLMEVLNVKWPQDLTTYLMADNSKCSTYRKNRRNHVNTIKKTWRPSRTVQQTVRTLCTVTETPSIRLITCTHFVKSCLVHQAGNNLYFFFTVNKSHEKRQSSVVVTEHPVQRCRLLVWVWQ